MRKIKKIEFYEPLEQTTVYSKLEMLVTNQRRIAIALNGIINRLNDLGVKA